MLALDGALMYLGGSIGRYRYADEPSKVLTLLRRSNRWNETGVVPPMLVARMWHSCVIARIGEQVMNK